MDQDEKDEIILQLTKTAVDNGYIEGTKDNPLEEQLVDLETALYALQDSELEKYESNPHLLVDLLDVSQGNTAVDEAVVKAATQAAASVDPNSISSALANDPEALAAAAEAADLAASQAAAATASPDIGAVFDPSAFIDERLAAQCVMIDLIPELSPINVKNRTNKDNKISRSFPYVTHMRGDANYFASYVNGSDIKSKFLDFTTAQISSLVPYIKLYKVIQVDETTTKDYLIPFSTHAAWTSGKTTYGTVEDLLRIEDREKTFDVGIKNFSWTLEGSNPISARRDISAKLVMFSNNLNNLAETFNIYSSVEDNPHCFKYLDLLLRSGKKFKKDKQFNAQYYTIKIEIGWNTQNTSLFTPEQIDSLKKNTSTMLLTLIDHDFNFGQDGTVTLTLNYRAYFEGLLFSEDADALKTRADQLQIEQKKQQVVELRDKVERQVDPEDNSTSSSQKTEEEKQYDLALKELDTINDEANRNAYRAIIGSLTRENKIYQIGINTAAYNSFKASIKSTSSLSLQSGLSVNDIDFFGDDPNAKEARKQAVENATKIATGFDPKAEEQKDGGNPDLSTLIPVQKDGYTYFTYFYLGDLLNHLINKVYVKLSNEPNKPNFLFGTALYRSRSNKSLIASVNIADIPISIEWFTEWFSSTIISQNKKSYQLIYLIRDFCSKLINNVMNANCDKSGVLKLQNKFNTINFRVKKNNNEDPIYLQKVDNIDKNLGDVSIDAINQIMISNEVQKDTDTNSTVEYLAIYCQDVRSPVSIKCEEDHKKGIYHFYFGRDRGLVKNINFTKSQVTGLRELNYIRESSGEGWEQLMTPYDVEMKMVGNNLFINGMMIYINPSGFGRKIGETSDPNSISYKLKLGGYHTIYRVESTISTSGFETSVKARWVGSGASIITNTAKPTSGAVTGNVTESNSEAAICDDKDDAGFAYPRTFASTPIDLGNRVKP